jgi:hypothetical protein
MCQLSICSLQAYHSFSLIDGGSTFHGNDGELLLGYTASHQSSTIIPINAILIHRQRRQINKVNELKPSLQTVVFCCILCYDAVW